MIQVYIFGLRGFSFMIICQEYRWGHGGRDDFAEMVSQGVRDDEAVFLLMMPAVTRDAGWDDGFAIVELQVLATIEEDNL